MTSLLKHDRRAESYLKTPVANLLGVDRTGSFKDWVGHSLLHYRIVERIGEGGMGVVYRAHDARLGRDVAIKVLPDKFAGDPEWVARFAREARLLASLNHPGIAAIHGFEEVENQAFLVLELVEGKTLTDRLKKGPLPLEKALGVCHKIAEALEAAHEVGVIHRDLKPSNIQLGREGHVKILDFGLAKALFEQASESADLGLSTPEAGAPLRGLCWELRAT
ncbi:MAG: serine/threonine-protein kinase [Acidobacteriota bacterium]